MADQASSIFPGDSTQNANSNPDVSNTQVTPPNDTLTTLLSTIKNERGEQKYATIELAMIALQNAQAHIPTLEQRLNQRDQELEVARKEAQRVQALEEAVAALTSRQDDNHHTGAPVMDEKTLADLINRKVSDTLSQKEQESLAKQNLNVVVSTLQQSFGADAEKKFYTKGQELGLDIAALNALAAKSPKAVLTMFGINEQAITNKPNQTSNVSTVNTSAFAPNVDTFIGRNPKSAIVGATNQDLKESFDRSKKMVDELHAQGLSVHDLSDPKVYSKMFK